MTLANEFVNKRDEKTGGRQNEEITAEQNREKETGRRKNRTKGQRFQKTKLWAASTLMIQQTYSKMRRVSTRWYFTTPRSKVANGSLW